MASASPSDRRSIYQEIFLEIRAGKMILEGTTVKPDTRKGLIRLARGDDGLVHFQWEDRMKDFPEDDLIIFPDEAMFERVHQSQGRVYILKFKHDGRKFFFWLQEPKADEDALLCSAVNFFINRLEIERAERLDMDEQIEAVTPPTLSETSGSVAGLETSSREESVDRAPPPVDTSSRDAVVAQGPVQLIDLQRILSSIAAGVSQSGMPMAMRTDTGPSLTEVLTPEVVVPLLENCHLEERLAPYLPEGSWTHESIIELMKSPQFHQQVEAFTHVLRSGQIDLSQFGIDPSKCDFTVSSFLEAFEDQVASKTNTNPLFADQRADSEGDNVSDDCAKNRKVKDDMEEGG